MPTPITHALDEYLAGYVARIEERVGTGRESELWHKGYNDRSDAEFKEQRNNMDLTMTKTPGGVSFFLDEDLYEHLPFASSTGAKNWLTEQFRCKPSMAAYIFDSLESGGVYEI